MDKAVGSTKSYDIESNIPSGMELNVFNSEDSSNCIGSSPAFAEETVADNLSEDSVWARDIVEPSLPEFHRGMKVEDDVNAPCWKKFMSFVGPGSLIAVGYMDPGNWSTDIAGGSAFGYKLLFVILLSSLIAMFLQELALRLGLSTSRDLAQACRDYYPPYVVYGLWIIMEVAICATDLAEVIGSAVALNLLFGIPLIAGVCMTAFDVLLLLFVNGRKFRVIEIIVTVLILIITVSFTAQLVLSKPNVTQLFEGFLPSAALVTNPEMLYIGVGIIGATVM